MTSELKQAARLEAALYEAGVQNLRSDLAIARQLQAARADGRGMKGGLLRDLRISKTRAFALLRLAEAVDHWISNGWIQDENSLSSQIAEGIHALVQADHAIQRHLCECLEDGQIITKRKVQEIEQEHCAEHSQLLPQFIRDRVTDRALPAKAVASLAALLWRLEQHDQQLVTSKLPLKATPDDIKEAVITARQLIAITDQGSCIEMVRQGCSYEEVERAKHQALKLDATGLLADAMKEAVEVERAARKLQHHQKRLAGVANRLAIECMNAPDLRAVVDALRQ